MWSAVTSFLQVCFVTSSSSASSSANKQTRSELERKRHRCNLWEGTKPRKRETQREGNELLGIDQVNIEREREREREREKEMESIFLQSIVSSFVH